MTEPFQYYHPYISPCDPCPPIKVKWYSTPPNLYIGFQPMNFPQFSPREALAHGTLWPPFVSPYPPKAAYAKEASLKEGADA